MVGRGHNGRTTSKNGRPRPYQNCSKWPPAAKKKKKKKTGRGSLKNRLSCPLEELIGKGTELNLENIDNIALTSDVDLDSARCGVADVVGGQTQVVAGVAGGDVAEVQLAVSGGKNGGAAVPGVGAVGVADGPAFERDRAVLDGVHLLLVRKQADLTGAIYDIGLQLHALDSTGRQLLSKISPHLGNSLSQSVV